MVSIIIPNYNKEKYLRQCIESVLNQTYTDIEVIIIDDVSTDSSREIILEYADKDSRVKPIFLKQNGGVSSARNTGILAAKGEYVTMLDSDDFYWNSGKIEAEMKIMDEHGGMCLTYSYRLLVDQDGKPLNSKRDESRYVSGTNMLYHFLTEKKANEYVQRDYIVPKKVLLDVGKYNTRDSYYEDYDLLLRLLNKCSIYYTGVYGTAYRIINNGLSQTQKKDDSRQFRVPIQIRKKYIKCIENPKERKKAYFILCKQMILTEFKILRRRIYVRG